MCVSSHHGTWHECGQIQDSRLVFNSNFSTEPLDSTFCRMRNNFLGWDRQSQSFPIHQEKIRSLEVSSRYESRFCKSQPCKVPAPMDGSMIFHTFSFGMKPKFHIPGVSTTRYFNAFARHTHISTCYFTWNFKPLHNFYVQSKRHIDWVAGKARQRPGIEDVVTVLIHLGFTFIWHGFTSYREKWSLIWLESKKKLLPEIYIYIYIIYYIYTPLCSGMYLYSHYSELNLHSHME